MLKIILPIILILLLLTVPTFSAIEEHCGIVTKVVDGDTFYISGLSERIRLADINAPEIYTTEGQQSKTALENLILGKMVCLDIDNLYKTDKYGRLVAIAYLDHNETHWLNVNQWLVENGYATYRDYPNEFRPPWSLYVQKTKTFETNIDYSNYIQIYYLVIIVILLLALIVINLTKRRITHRSI